MLNNIISVITIIAGLCSAVMIIGSFFGKPISFWTKRAREKRKAEEARRKEELVVSLQSAMAPQLAEIQRINVEQSHVIQTIQDSQVNILRHHILCIYRAGKETRTITESDKELLEDLYANYTSLDGNHYITQKYERMENWAVIPDDSEHHENIG